MRPTGAGPVATEAGGALPRPTSTAGDARKVCFDGTHRVLPPEETLRRIEPFFAVVGITRLADVTWLDEIGIPVYQAIRPNSWTLSVSQGKGLTPALAMASAVMEAVEGWHAEREGPGERRASVAEMEAESGYRVDELPLEPRHYLSPAIELEWTRATCLDTGASTFLPTALVRLDGRVSQAWTPPLFQLSSNGLASGNTYQEAVLHGLYEVVERDAVVRADRASHRQVLVAASVHGLPRDLLDRFSAAGVEVYVEVLPTPSGLACFRVSVWSELFPVPFGGAGCHLDRDVALCRALTEAAQSRVTEISGVRDDITAGGYRRAAEAVAGRSPRPAPGLPRSRPARPLAYDEVPTVRQDNLTDDLRLVVDRVADCTGRSPLAINHTKPELGIPVVRVVCPGMLFDPALT